MDVKNRAIETITPYENNPRRNAEAVDVVAESIRRFGFQQPLVVDENGVIVVGHTRYLAAKQLGLADVPCVVSHLSDEQNRQYRLVDNKVAEAAAWDFDLLTQELAALVDADMSVFGFVDTGGIDWDDVPDLSDETYDPPQKTLLKCPHCQHIDTATHFVKVNER